MGLGLGGLGFGMGLGLGRLGFGMGLDNNRDEILRFAFCKRSSTRYLYYYQYKRGIEIDC